MKRIFSLICFLLACTMLLCACGPAPQEQSPESKEVPQAQTTVSEAEGTQQTGGTETTETVPAEQEAPAEEAARNELPYTLRLGAEISFFDGPGYSHSYAQAIGEDGVYTIVEERMDEDNHLWGKLKSGVGWVDITAATSPEAQCAPIAACFADDLALQEGGYEEYILEDSDFTVRIAFRAGETLKHVTFSSLQDSEASFETAETFFTLEELTAETPLVVGVVFYGDLTAYGIAFEDAGGSTHQFSIRISGRNGALLLDEYD